MHKERGRRCNCAAHENIGPIEQIFLCIRFTSSSAESLVALQGYIAQLSVYGTNGVAHILRQWHRIAQRMSTT